MRISESLKLIQRSTEPYRKTPYQQHLFSFLSCNLKALLYCIECWVSTSSPLQPLLNRWLQLRVTLSEAWVTEVNLIDGIQSLERNWSSRLASQIDQGLTVSYSLIVTRVIFKGRAMLCRFEGREIFAMECKPFNNVLKAQKMYTN